jgi:hypothetical protein
MKLSAVLSITAIAQVSLADFYLFRVETCGDSGYQISDEMDAGEAKFIERLYRLSEKAV